MSAYTQNERAPKITTAIAKIPTAVAKKGNIFEFIDVNPAVHDNGFPKFALIVGSDSRCQDNVVSTIMLSTSYAGRDAIPVGEFDGFGTLYAKCGKVTFCRRVQLGEYIKTVNAHTMRQIDEKIVENLGLNEVIADMPVKKVEYEPEKATTAPDTVTFREKDNSEVIELKFKAEFYEKQYNELLTKVLKGEFK